MDEEREKGPLVVLVSVEDSDNEKRTWKRRGTKKKRVAVGARRRKEKTRQASRCDIGCDRLRWRRWKEESRRSVGWERKATKWNA